ncbi:jumonji family transcription factor [Sporothrix brasiliensis 5110]|uniref:[histone H3]-trimethyl-L-lysine(9) demethylase n=1 Tax=Sporothrix brasiliensis 5110 TaxID=1398154 RepID=A0A0C2IJ66_9PEZI|nr:jumonji family transcription factor [Sporothrix brasiliensis 5110]KIH89181.1 jumonji family transcription factor [Sporothrix brasiliensis 5110]
MMPTTTPSHASAGSENVKPDPQAPAPASDSSLHPPPAPSTGPDGATTGLHSPPDSNNASKLDGSSSDSELSDLDDDALAENLNGIQPEDVDATVTSVTTPTAAAADTVYAASAAASETVPTAATAPAAPGPGSSTTPASDDKPTATDAPAPEEEDDIGEVEPDHYSGTVPVFRPTMHQFRDFKKFMGKIDKYGMKSGIVKIIPPQEWKDALEPLDDLVKPIKVREPIKQDIMGSNGTYRQVNILHQRTYNLPQWRQLCDQSEHQPPARRGERRANADKPKPAPRARPAAAAAPAGAGASTKKGGTKKGRGGRRGGGGGGRTQRHTADDDNASTVSEPRPMTPESQRGDDEKMVLDDDKTCVESPQDATGKHQHDDREDADSAVMSSVEVEYPIKQEEDDDMTDIPAAPRRMGFVRQEATKKTQSTSARRKYSKREGSAKIDEAAFKDWDYRMDVSDYTPERCEELERSYWKTLTYAPPLYGADLPGTLFSENTELWNLNKLPNLLDVLGTKVPGVNTAYLYLGMWKATFAWHLEDVDLYSINYLHFGAPKQWYSISQGDARRFEAAMKNIWPADAKACDQFLRHKAFLISPSHLQQHYNIRVNKCVSYPGEFVVTYPYGYHSGYNLGYNCAEAVNFALDSWLPMGKIAKKCECAQAQDSVWVDVYEIERKLRGISTDDEDDLSDEDDEEYDSEEEGDGDDANSVAGLPTPPSGGRGRRVKFPGSQKQKRIVRPSAKRRRALGDADIDDADDDEGNRRLKKMRTRLWSGDSSPCCLCPNAFPDSELLPTDDGRDAHRLCASYLPEIRIETIDGKDVVKGVTDIQMPRMELRCLYCRLRKGVCLKCSHAKCTRSYHPTCAAAAGVFINEVDASTSGDSDTEHSHSHHSYEFTCRFQRTKRNRKLDALALEKVEHIRNAAAALQPGSICQMQLYRSDIFAGVVVENRPDEESLLLRIVPSGEEVEVSWKWLLVPDAVDYRRLLQSATHRDATSRKESERSASLPIMGDLFVEGYMWKQFQDCEGTAFVPAPEQVKVDLDKPNQLWHYLGKPSTESKDQYTGDPANPVNDRKSHFLDSLPPVYNSVIPTPAVPQAPFVFTVPAAPSSIPNTHIQPAPGQTAGQSGIQPSPASRTHQPGHRNRHRSASASQKVPFGPFFSMPKLGGASSKFPQIHHPNLSHGYATVSTGKPQTAGGAMSPPSGSTATGGEKSTDSSNSSSRRNSVIHGPNRVRKSSSGAASLAAAAAKLHKRSASSMSSVSSFGLGLGGGLRGLSRPSPHTNYVGPPPVPSSTASSPLLSAHNLSYNTRPGSVSSYASYESIMGPGMSPHSPNGMDASPFIGSPGPQIGSFDFPTPSGSTNGYQHPGLRPQFGAAWQQSFHAPLGSFAQDMDINFSPPSPMSTSLGLPAGGLGAPANIVSNHQSSYSFGGPGNLGPDSMLLGGSGGDFGGFGTISPPLVPESPMAMMSPALEDVTPPDAGTSQSPAEQLKQQLRSISDSSLPSSYRLRCLHQPRRRHQSRSSLNRIFTSQLLDLSSNPT